MEIFSKAKIDPFITTLCTSGHGISACILDLALRSLGNPNSCVFVGGWKHYVRHVMTNLFYSALNQNPISILVNGTLQVCPDIIPILNI